MSQGKSSFEKGKKIRLTVTTDNSRKTVFKSFTDDSGAEKLVHMIHVECFKHLKLTVGHVWEGVITRICQTSKMLNIRGAERRVVYLNVKHLKRVEERHTKIEGDKIYSCCFSGGHVISKGVIQAVTKPLRIKYDGNLHDIKEVFVGGKLVARIHVKLVGKIGGDFSKLAPEFSKSQFASLGKFYVSWDNMQALHAEAQHQKTGEVAAAQAV